jgi:hypothetical protein
MFQPRNHLIGFLAALLAVVSHRAGSSARSVAASQSPIRCALMSAFSCERLDQIISSVARSCERAIECSSSMGREFSYFCIDCSVVDLHLVRVCVVLFIGNASRSLSNS